MRRIPYYWLLAAPYAAFAVGFLLNGIVTLANHHQMPVYPVGGNCDFIGDDLVHSCMTAHTHLKFLADVFVTNDGVSSIGDAFMEAYYATKIPMLIAWGILIARDVCKEYFY